MYWRFQPGQLGKKIKGIHIGKEKAKLSVDDTILHIENTKESTIKLLELINGFSKVSGYKTNKQNQLLFLYICNEQYKRKQFRLQQYVKLGANLTKEKQSI